MDPYKHQQQTPEPENSAPAEESIFEDVQVDMRPYQKHIARARILLFIIAGLQLLAIFLLDRTDETAFLIDVSIQVFTALVFAALAFWTKYKPYAALVTALVVYLAIFGLSVIVDSSMLFRGILVKIIVIILLVRGISNAREVEEIKKTFNR